MEFVFDRTEIIVRNEEKPVYRHFSFSHIFFFLFCFQKASTTACTSVPLGRDLRRSMHTERGRSPQIAAGLVIMRRLPLR